MNWLNIIIIEIIIRIPALKRSLLTDAAHNLAKARRLWKQTKYLRSKKNIAHGLRYLYFGLQLLKYGKIIDFQEANPIYWEVFYLLY